MVQLAEWFAVGLIAVMPAGLWLPKITWFPIALAAVPTGFLFQQLARYRLEVSRKAFDGAERPPLAFIRERLGLKSASEAYQIYEVTFYRHPQWQAARDHIHRCWHWIVLLRAASKSSLTGAVVLALAGMGPQRGILDSAPAAWFLVAGTVSLLAGSALLLARKAAHTERLLHRFDCAWVVVHWPAYEAVATELARESCSRSTSQTATSVPTGVS